MSNQTWKEVGSWNVGRDDGTSEKFILSRSEKTGGFQIKNDYGNIVIDMETMSGLEFVRRVLESMEKEIGVAPSDGWFDHLFDQDSVDGLDGLDCDSGN